MEYYGKILCISYNDLTYDDRPVMVNGKADYSRSRTLKGVHPSTLSEEELAPIMSIPNYKKLAAKEKINVVRSGRGLGGYVLVEIATMPLRFQERIKLKYGDMKEDVIRNWLGSHYHIDAKAREFYTRFRFDNGDALPPEHIQEYTVNASVIEAVMRAMGCHVYAKGHEGRAGELGRTGRSHQLLPSRVRTYLACQFQPL